MLLSQKKINKNTAITPLPQLSWLARKDLLIAQRLNCKWQIKTVSSQAAKLRTVGACQSQGFCGHDQRLMRRERDESAAQSPTQAPWLGQKLRAARENHCPERAAKGTGAAVETGSASLYGLSLSFPSNTYFYLRRVSQQAIQLPFRVLCSTSHRRGASEPPSSSGGHAGQGSKIVSRNLTASCFTKR